MSAATSAAMSAATAVAMAAATGVGGGVEAPRAEGRTSDPGCARARP
jgi:hypothetical protein